MRRHYGVKIIEALNDTGDTKTMNRIYTHCLTLRLTPDLDELLTEAAFDGRITKSDWIRVAIRQRLRQRRQTEPAMQEPVLRQPGVSA
jgi:hypothetical protein